MQDIFDKIAALRRDGASFAVATVVARRAPVSAHLGDRALVYGDGRMEGFVGGACSREIIRKQGLEAIRARHARLVSIRPDAQAQRKPDAEHVVVLMSCASEGAVDVYVEPFGPPRHLVIVGATPVADALARLGRGLGYLVSRVVDEHEQRDLAPPGETVDMGVATLASLETVLARTAAGTAAVVASQGHYDEEALETILKSGRASYVGLVASRKRGEAVRAFLENRAAGDVAAIRNPAGLDLGARTAPEVALSILAEIVQRHPSGVAEEAPVTDAVPGVGPNVEAVAIDPVCGMEVTVAGARHRAEVDGAAYYFCCVRCRERFVEEPRRYLPAAP